MDQTSRLPLVDCKADTAKVVTGRDERVGLIAGAFGAMFTANREGDRARREIEQIAEQLQVLERQRCRAEVSGW